MEPHLVSNRIARTLTHCGANPLTFPTYFPNSPSMDFMSSLHCSPEDVIPGPTQASFSNSSPHQAPNVGQPAAENLRRLASRYIHQPDSQVNVVRIEPGSTGQYRVEIVLEIADFLQENPVQENTGNDYFGRSPEDVIPGPTQAAFSNSSPHRAPNVGQSSAENLRRLASLCIHHPDSQVDMVRIEPGSAGPRLEIALELAHLDFHQGNLTLNHQGNLTLNHQGNLTLIISVG